MENQNTMAQLEQKHIKELEENRVKLEQELPS